MSLIIRWFIAVTLLIATLAVGYWLGRMPQNDESITTLTQETGSEKKILYYRNPMGLPDTSPVPKKDPMGMDYLPVYDDESSSQKNDSHVISISTEKVQKLGVRTEIAHMRELMRTVRAVATVQADERKQYAVTTKFEGWIQRLYVNTTGHKIKKGDALMDIYSPELISAQQEYLIAAKGLQTVSTADSEIRSSMQRLVNAALQKLRNWDIAESEIRRLQHSGTVQQYLTLRAQADGIVMEKKAVAGQRFMPGDMLYQIADLSNIWLMADVFEQDLGLIHTGQIATIRIDAYPDKIFTGTVAFVYPSITPETRTAIVRIELTNPDYLLKPAMYAHIELTSWHSKGKVLTVPDSAVLDSGTRRVVLVDLGEGRFEPRSVKPGLHADGFTEILGGLRAGESVVVKANFLLDAESNFRNALSSFSHSTPSQQIEDRDLPPVPAAQHHGDGRIEAIDLSHASLTIAHGPIDSLRWPAMTMDFQVNDAQLLQSLKPGQDIHFAMTENSAGEFVIVQIQPAFSTNKR